VHLPAQKANKISSEIDFYKEAARLILAASFASRIGTARSADMLSAEVGRHSVGQDEGRGQNVSGT
jgi:hypothetical protein